MKNITTIMDKEIRGYFTSPIAYLALVLFLLITGFSYSFYITKAHYGEMDKVFWGMIYLFIVILPSFTMHLFSEERRSGTIELLMTYPVQDWEVVIGKYLASMALFLGMIVLTFHFPLFLLMWGSPDPGTIFGGYIGLFFIGSSFLAIGILATSATKSSNAAYIITAGVLFGFLIIGSIGYFGTGGIFKFLSYISLTEHFRTFTLGIINTRDLIFYLSVIIFALFLSVRVVEIERWKG